MNAADKGLPDFSGKVVVFYIGVERKTATLRSPQFDLQGERLFLSGETATSPGHWAEDAMAVVAWDSVSSYLVFDQREWTEKSKQIEKARKARNRSKQWLWPWNSGT